MGMSLTQLASVVDGQLCGDGDIEIMGAATIQDARAGDVTLLDNPKLAKRLRECQASAVLVPRDLQPIGIPYVTVEQVHEAFATIVCHFRPPRPRKRVGISAAFVGPSAKIGTNVDIYPTAYVEDDVQIGADSVIHAGVRILAGCKIGEGVTIFPNVVLYENTVVGDRSMIHSGSVIGAFGFGYSTTNGQHRLSAQFGNVEIGSDVEIGACTTIDRGTYGPTVIGDGTKIDNQVMIAHNCRIGRHNILCSHVGIAGSCTTGDYVVMAGQVGIGDHINIGHQVTLGAKAGVMHDIPDGETHVGIPATPVRDQMVKQAAFAKLPEMRKQLKSLQHQIDELSARSESTPRQDAA